MDNRDLDRILHAALLKSVTHVKTLERPMDNRLTPCPECGALPCDQVYGTRRRPSDISHAQRLAGALEAIVCDHDSPMDEVATLEDAIAFTDDLMKEARIALKEWNDGK